MINTLAAPLVRIRGAFARCAARFTQLGRPGCKLWTEAGERAVDEAQHQVEGIRREALDAEISDRRAVEILDEVLRDGQVDASEISALREARKQVKASAAADARIQEAVI